jgi:hypothetical protein
MIACRTVLIFIIILFHGEAMAWMQAGQLHRVLSVFRRPRQSHAVAAHDYSGKATNLPQVSVYDAMSSANSGSDSDDGNKNKEMRDLDIAGGSAKDSEPGCMALEKIRRICLSTRRKSLRREKFARWTSL